MAEEEEEGAEGNEEEDACELKEEDWKLEDEGVDGNEDEEE